MRSDKGIYVGGVAVSNEIIEHSKSEYTETVISEIKELLNKSRNTVAMQVNSELLATYWKIGE